MKIIIEEWDGDGAIRIPDEALQELELDVGDSLYLIEEFVGNTRCLVLSKKPQMANRIRSEAGDKAVPMRREPRGPAIL
ncbi:AbrB/MazE/SpoVT family DNA-binding domain-containing protein [Pseudomonas sp. LS2P72]